MTRTVNLGGILVGEGQPAYICAELGINGNGDVRIYEQMIDAAARAGAQAVKLQKRTIDLVYTPEELASPRESPWGKTFREQKEGLELDRDAYVHLAAYAKERGLVLTASCWDEGALGDVVKWIDPPWLKIASASITDHMLVQAYAWTGKPLVMSTGMSTLDEIDSAIGQIESVWGKLNVEPGLVLLACTSTYPCDDSEINLLTIDTLRETFGLPVGYSGHERGIATTVAAVALGACCVERHLTLDRTMYGSDQAASLEPQGFIRLVRDIRAVEKALGDGVKRRLVSEEPVRRKLRRVG